VWKQFSRSGNHQQFNSTVTSVTYWNYHQPHWTQHGAGASDWDCHEVRAFATASSFASGAWAWLCPALCQILRHTERQRRGLASAYMYILHITLFMCICNVISHGLDPCSNVATIQIRTQVLSHVTPLPHILEGDDDSSDLFQTCM
jgi:hypothetical protein